MIKIKSFRFRLSLLFVIFLGLLLIAYNAFLYFDVRFILYRDLDKELTGKAQELGSIIESYFQSSTRDRAALLSSIEKAIRLEKAGPNVENISLVEARYLQNVDIYDLRNDYVNVLSEKGEALSRLEEFHPASLWNDLKKMTAIPPGLPEIFFRNIKSEGQDFRFIFMPHDIGTGETYWIQIGTSLTSTIHSLRARTWAMMLSIPFVLIASGFVGYFWAHRAIKPVLAVAKTARSLTHEGLNARVKSDATDEEIKFLVDAFNDMIARLEKSFQYIQQFSSHVSHELKTPIAIIRGESQVALLSDRDKPEYRRVLQGILDETERMMKVVDDLLFLTKVEYGSEVFHFEPFCLAEFMKDIYENAKIMASEKEIAVTLNVPEGEEMKIRGDSLHLRRLFFNLLDNAIKFSPAKNKIMMHIESHGREVRISIEDHGCGVEPENLPKIFEPFFHRSQDPRHPVPGAGLGLNLAMSIAKAHRGTIDVQSRVGQGSIFTVTLPLF